MNATVLRILKVAAAGIGLVSMLYAGTMLYVVSAVMEVPAVGRGMFISITVCGLFAGIWLVTLAWSPRHARPLGRLGLLLLALGLGVLAAYPPAELHMTHTGRIAMGAFAVLAVCRLAGVFKRRITSQQA